MNLFVLVSTGQRVANLPPVLEHARVGDHALWVESDEARRGNWTAGPRELLEERGLITVDVVEVARVNDPALLTAALAPFAESVRGQYESVYLVANGGTKLSPVGLLFGLEALSPRLLYGDERPAVHSLYPAGLDAAPAVALYTRPDPSDAIRSGLDLPDILRLNGYTFATKSPHIRVWPGALPSDCANARYGRDEGYTYYLHELHRVWAAAQPNGSRVPFVNLPALVPTALTGWQHTVQQVLRKGATPQLLTNLYNATLNLGEGAQVARARQGAGVAEPPERIGAALEYATARAVHAWLEARPHPAVRSVWLGAQVARTSTPDTKDAEFDVLLVLTNGVLIHLECKAASVEARELDVGIHRLRQAASQLARTAVVVPVFTRQVTAPWFTALHVTRTELASRFGPDHAISFTWPGQPDRYTVPGSEPPEETECLEFEEALGNLLQPYRL